MSITKEALEKLREALKPNHPGLIAKELGKSTQWINRVLAKTELASKHTPIIEAALKLVEDEKQKVSPLVERINEVVS